MKRLFDKRVKCLRHYDHFIAPCSRRISITEPRGECLLTRDQGEELFVRTPFRRLDSLVKGTDDLDLSGRTRDLLRVDRNVYDS